MTMDFNDFKILYAETMMYYQLIEHDIKFIYSSMHKGNVAQHLESVENKTLGQMIRTPKKLDESDSKPLISTADYNFLTQICDNRNHWAHQTFIEFVYIQNDAFSSNEYKKQCDKLTKDHNRVQRASGILEEMRIEYCKRMKR